MPLYKKIVVGVDESAANNAVVDYASRLSSETGSPLVLVHVDELSPRRGGPHIRRDGTNELLDAVSRRAADLGAKVDHTVEGFEGVGGTARVIIDVAEEEEADLIVVGSAGPSAWTGALLGSVAMRVLHHAPCPVTVVPTRN